MRKRYYGLPVITLCLITMLLGSCKDEWDNHYYPEINGKSSMSLYNYIESRPDLSIFTQMLKMKGYDTTLNSAQTYTVWAPLNSSLSGVNLSDTLTVRRIVQNHITQFSIPTASISPDKLTMLDRKLLTFANNGSDFTLEGKSIVEPDKAMANGILHVVDSFVPYKLNTWEYMNETAGLDSVRNYIKSLSRKVYNPTASFNSDGVFVDSVKTDYNPVFAYLCKMESEDSTYTSVFPDNTAWSDAYSRIYPFYRTLPASGGVATQVAFAKSALIQDLFFTGKFTVPVAKDTLVSTWGNKLSNGNDILGGNEMSVLSNGLAYKTSLLKHQATESWYKEIRVEAESIFGTDSLKSNYAMSPTSSIGTKMSVSNNYYLKATPTTSSSISKLFLKFPIPNTLSAKYNIYCKFIPTSIVDTTVKIPYKVNFYITYRDNNGKLVKDSKLSVNNVTDPTKPTKMLVVKNFQFPFSNIVSSSDNSAMEKISVFLKVENAATPTEDTKKTYSRTLLIDCIILEPVQ